MVLVICFCLFFSALLLIVSQRGNFFIVLLSFELITLTLFIFLLSCCYRIGNSRRFFICLIFLVIRVCEATLGLGLLVRSIRRQGYDSINVSLRLKF